MMAMNEITYSRVIRWLKVLLPILALAILSTLFLVARNVDPAQQLPFADVDVDEIAREQRIGAPEFEGVTADGTAIALKAQRAVPDPNRAGRVMGEEVMTTLELPNGEQIVIEAGALELNQPAGMAELLRRVVITSDAGYRLETEALAVSLNQTWVASNTPVRVASSLGEISASSFELSPKGGAERGPLQLVFKGRVKLLYQAEHE